MTHDAVTNAASMPLIKSRSRGWDHGWEGVVGRKSCRSSISARTLGGWASLRNVNFSTRLHASGDWMEKRNLTMDWKGPESFAETLTEDP